MEFIIGSVIGIAGLIIGIIGSWEKLAALFSSSPALPIEGTHYSYHYTQQFNKKALINASRLLKGTWTFSKNRVGKISLEVSYENDKKRYTGNVLQRDQHVYITLQGIGFEQVVFCMLLKPSPPCHGVWLALNDANWITTDCWYLSDEEISTEIAEELIEKGRKELWAMQQANPAGFL